jgi:two-component system response regulator AlgR
MKRILIADDNATVRRGLRRLIDRNRDWDVCGEAVDGRDAVDRARELHPDVVLLDLAMPGMNGFDAAWEIARLELPVQILLCTIQLSSYVVREAEKRGIQGAVSKSKTSEITDGIAALLRHETFYCWPAD